jgi:hypothetical protein
MNSRVTPMMVDWKKAPLWNEMNAIAARNVTILR